MYLHVYSHAAVVYSHAPPTHLYSHRSHRNLTLLRHFGADILPFDPLVDERLPDGVAGVYLGGGYPELHAAALSANLGMRAALRAFAAEGGVVYAECGGLMYLARTLQVDAPHGPVYDMGAFVVCRELKRKCMCVSPPCVPTTVGVFPFATVMNPDKMHMGYVEVTTLAGCPLFPPGTTARCVDRNTVVLIDR